MEEAIELYIKTFNIVFISILVIVILAITASIILVIKKRKSKMICISCTRQIDSDSLFCKYCGSKQNRSL